MSEPIVLVEEQPAPIVVVTEPAAPPVVFVAPAGRAGPPGAQGLPGDVGDPGPPGPTGPVAAVVWRQDMPLAVWVIPHSLNAYPTVTVIDSLAEEVVGDITYPDPNTVVITFASAFSGTARLI